MSVGIINVSAHLSETWTLLQFISCVVQRECLPFPQIDSLANPLMKHANPLRQQFGNIRKWMLYNFYIIGDGQTVITIGKYTKFKAQVMVIFVQPLDSLVFIVILNMPYSCKQFNTERIIWMH